MTKPKTKTQVRCQVFAKVCGYCRPIDRFNVGKQQEFKDRKTLKV